MVIVLNIRLIRAHEIMLLTEFLYESIFQEKAEELAPRTVIQNPVIWIYVDEFGAKKDDHCFVAEVDNVIVGAVWVRCIKGFGYIDGETPEFAVSIYSDYRGKGIGTQLMKKMLEHLKINGYSKASLAVQKNNKACNLYCQ